MPPFIIYSRKSQGEDDKQVQSIPDQERELTSLAAKLNLPVKGCLSEAKSAKAPGRQVFNELMDKVEKGKIAGILCWKLDRLARNPVDGGRIIWAIKQQGLVVRTPHQVFSRVDDNLILMYIEFGMAQKYVDDLGKNTARGLKSKAEKGWRPGRAPVGYLNSKIEEHGHRKILSDPARFLAVRRMWDLMLTGEFTIGRIQHIVNNDWGFRTAPTKRRSAAPLSKGVLHKMFSNPFYAGHFEYPQGSGRCYQGNHEAMISDAEFERVQNILHKPTNPRPRYQLPLLFRGLIKCGECGSTITAHVKEQIRCPECRYKFSIRNQPSCPRCPYKIGEKDNSQVRRYVYYHCTRTLNASCQQKGISAAALDDQAREKLKQFTLPPKFRDWGLAYIERLRNRGLPERNQILSERKKAYEKCVSQLENLVRLKTSPENIDNSLLTDEEYQKQRLELLAQKTKFTSESSSVGAELDQKAHLAKKSLLLIGSISEKLNGSKEKAEILRAIGSNHVLIGKNLEIRPEFPFSHLPPTGIERRFESSRIEPENIQAPYGQNGQTMSINSNLVQERYEDRTKSLKIALDTIWKKLDPDAPAFKRYPFVPHLPASLSIRGKDGRFVGSRSSGIPRS